MKDNDPIVTFRDVTCKKQTDKAILVVVEDEEHWIPQSHVHGDSEVFDDGDNAGPGTLVISEWIAKQRGLV